MGAKIANPDLFVMASGGDGDGLSIGAGHFVHACRRNLDVVYIMMQNYIYGLTKGQPSPSTETGHVTAASPFGSTEYPVNSVALAITSGA
ncbi:MAG: 2-oxoacid:ferredoxin oxidoreductase subunit beta, partial [Deltaproteobacteria bacterium]